ncbi:MAG: hypothetical protein GW893_03035 [Armatimonadetes bacterium]|nr:hypothetical protein [Armatimonadota bacterium]
MAYSTEAFCPACGNMLKSAPTATASPSAATPPAPPISPSPIAPPAVQRDPQALCPLSSLMLGGLAAKNVRQEQIVFSVENEENAVALVGLSQGVLVLRTGDMAGGYGGIDIKAFPYGSISEVKSNVGPMTGKIQFTVHMHGGKPQVGRRARMSSQKKVQLLAALPNERIPAVTEKFKEMVANLSDV